MREGYAPLNDSVVRCDKNGGSLPGSSTVDERGKAVIEGMGKGIPPRHRASSSPPGVSRLIALPHTRFFLVAAGLALSSTAGWFGLRAVEPVPVDDVERYREALRHDNGNAYLWADLAEALAASGQTGQDKLARQCMDRAVALSGAIPAIWVRHANFYFLGNEPKIALQSAARVLQTVPDYDDILFHYFDQIVDDPKLILTSIGDQRRATRSWMSYLIRVNKLEAAQLTWRHIHSSGYADPPLAATYADFLLRNRQWDLAQSSWASAVAKQAGDYPSRNLLFNGAFKFEFLPGPLDWQLRSEPDQFETLRENGAIRIRFHGKTNVTYDHLSQTAILPRPGRYRLSMRIKTENLTTNEGLRLAITDLALVSDPITGTNDWTTVTLNFAATQPRAVRVAVIRRPSQKFDNKIDGSATIQSITLVSAE